MGMSKRRTNDELEDEPAVQRKKKDHYLEGIYKAQPEHFRQAWPTVRTQTIVDMVLGSIEKRGRATQREIEADTGLNDEVIGVALADLLSWKKQVGTELKEEGRVEVREYFVK